MTRVTAGALIVGMVSSLAAEEKDADATIKQMLRSSETLVEILKSVKDVGSARDAGPKLEKAYAEMRKRAKELSGMPPERRRALQAKYLKDFERSRNAFRAEKKRIAKDKEVMAILAKMSPFGDMGEARREMAQAQVKVLTQAVRLYKVENAAWPTKLSDLVEKQPNGSPPLVEKGSLNDPWGRALEYDPKGPKNRGTLPDIWSLGPPENKGEAIGNWPEKK